MNILLVNRWYPPYTGNGGVAAYHYYLAHALQRQGQRVSVLAARWSATDPEVQDDGGIKVFRLLAVHHARLHRLPLFGRYMRPLFQWLYSRKVAAKINKLEREGQIDLIEFAEVNAEAYAYLHRQARQPVVVRCHTPIFVLRQFYDPQEITYDTEITTRMEQFCISAADALSAPSADMARVIESSCHPAGKSIAVIPNLLDLSKFSNPERAVRPPGNNLTILHVGRLERVKGVEVLIQAAPALIKQFPETHFVLIGAGSAAYLVKLRQLIRAVGLKEEQFQFLGEASQDTLIEWYQRADVAVVPTLNYESFSYTVAQAMASGLPVIASRIGGIPETLGKDGAGILVEPGNVAQLADALISLCSDSGMRQSMGKAGRSRAESYFSDVIVADKMIEFYSSLEARKPIGRIEI